MPDTHLKMADRQERFDSPSDPPSEAMVWVPGGHYLMGSEEFYPEERPVRRVAVHGFWMDECPVTVAEFGRFVSRTGYVTVSGERPGTARD
jgi:formylglycine-generating enzyme